MHIHKLQNLIDIAGSARAQGKREPAAEAIILHSIRELQPAVKNQAVLSGNQFKAIFDKAPGWLRFEPLEAA